VQDVVALYLNPPDRPVEALRQRLMVLQPISPLLSGESGTHIDMSWADAVFTIMNKVPPPLPPAMPSRA